MQFIVLQFVIPDHVDCVELLKSIELCEANDHDLTCAESFVAMFESFSIENEHADVVEDTFQVRYKV